MNKVTIFFLALSLSLGAQGVDTRPAKPLVTRYPALVDSFMYRLSSSKSLAEFARERRGTLEVVPENQYTRLFQDAQREVGIPESDILPIKIVDAPEDTPLDIAVTNEKCMEVVPKNFDLLPYGAKRAAALHEALHHKYHDQNKHIWAAEKIGLAALATTGLMTVGLWMQIYTKKQSNFRMAKALGAPFGSLLLSFITAAPVNMLVLSQDYYEFRADRDSVELLKCHKCAHDLLRVCKQEHDHYLNTSDVTRYYEKYEAEKLLCDHHKTKSAK